jgi:hypothetical protein
VAVGQDMIFDEVDRGHWQLWMSRDLIGRAGHTACHFLFYKEKAGVDE